MCSSGAHSTSEVLLPRGSRQLSHVLHIPCITLSRLRRGTYRSIYVEPSRSVSLIERLPPYD